MTSPATHDTPHDSPAKVAQNDAAGSIVLILATLAALVFANSVLAATYQNFLDLPVQVRFGDFEINKPLVLWINDGLMAIFFFLVGLEIKAEMVEGALSSRDKALLPMIGAIGGMAVPAAIYIAISWGNKQALAGWAIPAATDIAFAVGILGLVGRRAPPALKVFLLALAVLDDLGAIIIIALFYTHHLSPISLLLAAFFIGVLAAMNRAGIMRASAYVLVGLALWVCVLKSGVHATLAGVATALFVPIKGRAADEHGPLHALASDLQWPVTFMIVPLFAFANAGVPLNGIEMQSLAAPVTLSVIAGLVIGKPVGVIGATWLAVKTGLGKLPAGIHWRHMTGAGFLAGIGFTMSLFIGTLAFTSRDMLNEVRLGVLIASTISALLGAAIFMLGGKRGR